MTESDADLVAAPAPFMCVACGGEAYTTEDKCPHCNSTSFTRVYARRVNLEAMREAADAHRKAEGAKAKKRPEKRAESAQAVPGPLPVEAARAAGEPGTTAYRSAYCKAARALPGRLEQRRLYNRARRAKIKAKEAEQGKGKA